VSVGDVARTELGSFVEIEKYVKSMASVRIWVDAVQNVAREKTGAIPASEHKSEIR
jgi:hypothetical protein